MKFIEELVEYFSELLTEEQKNQLELLCGDPASRDPDSDGRDVEDNFDGDDEYDPYEEYEFPAPDRRQGHASGKRRPLRQAAITAAGLVAAVRTEARKHWKAVPVARDLVLALAETHDRNYLANRSRAGVWRRFTAAVESLKELDADPLSEVMERLLAAQTASGDGRGLFRDWFEARRNGVFSLLADRFCRRRVDGVAGRATLAALRRIAYPEKVDPAQNTNVYRPFLDDPELVAIFDYYRVLRKLEFIQSKTIEEAARRLKKGYY